jgi:hypothetical protein
MPAGAAASKGAASVPLPMGVGLGKRRKVSGQQAPGRAPAVPARRGRGQRGAQSDAAAEPAPAERPAKTPRAGVDLFCHEQMGEGFVGFKTYAARASSQDTLSSAAAAHSAGATVHKGRKGLSSYGDLSEAAACSAASWTSLNDLAVVASKLSFSGDVTARAAASQSKLTSAAAGPTALSTCPLDWSLKKQLRITSSAPLDWTVEFRNKRTIPAQHYQTFLAQPVSRLEEEAASAASERCCQALLQWEHPASALPSSLAPSFRRFNDPEKSVSRAVTGEPGKILKKQSQKGSSLSALPDHEYFRLRAMDFEAAFSSLWTLLREGQCQYFFYLGPRAHVLFIGEGVGVCREDEESAPCAQASSSLDPTPLSAYVTRCVCLSALAGVCVSVCVCVCVQPAINTSDSLASSPLLTPPVLPPSPPPPPVSPAPPSDTSSTRSFRDQLEEQGIQYATPLQTSPLSPTNYDPSDPSPMHHAEPEEDEKPSFRPGSVKGGGSVLDGTAIYV